MREREQMIEFDRQYCQHYAPGGITMIGGKEPTGRCKAGVVYLDQFGRAPKEDASRHIAAGLGDYYENAGIFNRICCTDGGKRTEEEQLARCPKWERRTLEQAAERADEFEQSMARMELVGAVLKPWRTWTRQNRVAKAEVIEFPACKGRLHLSQAAYNGHVHGHCETAGCVSWME